MRLSSIDINLNSSLSLITMLDGLSNHMSVKDLKIKLKTTVFCHHFINERSQKPIRIQSIS